MTAYQRCEHGGRPCPRIIQAIPLPSAVPHRRPLWPSLVVAGGFLAIAILNDLVPRVVEVLADALAVLP